MSMGWHWADHLNPGLYGAENLFTNGDLASQVNQVLSHLRLCLGCPWDSIGRIMWVQVYKERKTCLPVVIWLRKYIKFWVAFGIVWDVHGIALGGLFESRFIRSGKLVYQW
jgi:hypothetical protein